MLKDLNETKEIIRQDIFIKILGKILSILRI